MPIIYLREIYDWFINLNSDYYKLQLQVIEDVFLLNTCNMFILITSKIINKQRFLIRWLHIYLQKKKMHNSIDVILFPNQERATIWLRKVFNLFHLPIFHICVHNCIALEIFHEWDDIKQKKEATNFFVVYFFSFRQTKWLQP